MSVKYLILAGDVTRWLVFAFCGAAIVATVLKLPSILQHIFLGLQFAFVLIHAVIFSVLLSHLNRERLKREREGT